MKPERGGTLIVTHTKSYPTSVSKVFKYEFWIALVSLVACAPLEAYELQSPDGSIALSIDTTTAGEPYYEVRCADQTLIAASRLGFELDGQPALKQGFEIVNVATDSRDHTWKPVYGERSTVHDRYRSLTIDLQDQQQPPRRMQISFRAYNEAVAFRYTIPNQNDWGQVRVTGESSEFRFSSDHDAWAVYHAQGRYQKQRISQIKTGCERPLTIQCGPRRFLAIGEAGLVDYARMKFAPAAQQPGLVSSLSSTVVADLPLATPWRVIMVAKTPGQLLENNFVFLNLNEPCAIDDTSWIRPGKIIREVTLTTTGGKRCVDFAVRRGLQFVEFDAGWYGHENSGDSDATTVTLDPKRSSGPLDLPEVVRYATERDIGVILYVNRRALEQQLDEILPLYRQWGIRGVKYGFVNVGSQRWTSWLHEAVRKAADHQLMVDVHDEYRPTGYSRTYPNLMTQEGIAGDETAPTNQQTLTILFSRMLAGAGDNTICYYDSRVNDNASHAYQLAKAVCFYSPWQFLYWYDRPSGSPPTAGGAGGSRNVIGDEPELEFFDRVPTTWDDTRVISGEIGSYAVVARRSGSDWFVGCMNGNETREFAIPLTFLESDHQYTAHIYRDDPAVRTRTRVGIERKPVSRQTVLHTTVQANGGVAVRLERTP